MRLTPMLYQPLEQPLNTVHETFCGNTRNPWVCVERSLFRVNLILPTLRPWHTHIENAFNMWHVTPSVWLHKWASSVCLSIPNAHPFPRHHWVRCSLVRVIVNVSHQRLRFSHTHLFSTFKPTTTTVCKSAWIAQLVFIRRTLSYMWCYSSVLVHIRCNCNTC